MIGPPKSLTAIVHVRFHYDEEGETEPGAADLEMVGKLLERASKMEPDMRDILVKFADYLQKVGRKEDGQSP